MCWSLMSGSPKGKKEKNEEGQRGTIPLNPLEVSSARGEGAYNNRGRSNNSDCLFLCASWIRSSNQQSERRFPVFGAQGPFCLPSLLWSVCKVLQEQVHHCLPCGWGGGKDNCLCAKSWNEPQCIVQVFFPLEVASLQQIPDFHNSSFKQIPPIQFLSRWEGRFP